MSGTSNTPAPPPPPPEGGWRFNRKMDLAIVLAVLLQLATAVRFEATDHYAIGADHERINALEMRMDDGRKSREDFQREIAKEIAEKLGHLENSVGRVEQRLDGLTGRPMHGSP